ncbi:response regulator transcription factor [Belnapia sp. F-4-1]|uniref:LuxR C-terminal-related transcriptional regulator n=1 Tax=Belnapia sp. F-4-1 TaxID=1545443 RepID=UPI0009DD3810|nr:response regulator transcription factor [Belnapia sp. F-4-1]
MADDRCDSRSPEDRATPANKSCRILLVDPSPLRREGLRRLLEDVKADGAGYGFSVLGAIASLDQAAPDSSVGLVVLNSVVPASAPQGLAHSIQQAQALCPGAPIVVLSDRDEAAEVVAALRAGACGFITADMDPNLVFYALNFIAHGGVYFPPQALLARFDGPDEAEPRAAPGPPLIGELDIGLTSLTARQKRVLQLLRQGQSNKRIAIELHMCESTVKVHVREIMRKLKVANRTQAALCAASLDLPDEAPIETAIPQVAQAGLERPELQLIPA